MRLADALRMQRWDPADEQTTAACYAVLLAAHQVDEPIEPPMSAGLFELFLREGLDIWNPGESWVARDDAGEVRGFYRIDLPDLENLDRAGVSPYVHPAARRQGAGGALLRHAAGRASAAGRTVMEGLATEGSAGEAFARAVGGRLELADARRVQYLHKIPDGKLTELKASAQRAAAGYSIVHWTGLPPEEYLRPLAYVVNAFEDAPRGEGVEPEVWDAERLRERSGSAVRAGVIRSYNVAALHDASGDMAGYSEVLVDPHSPQWGYQQLTAVTRPHRGHRLGLLLKTAMLELLAAAEPQVEMISTGNSTANEHMIAVNEQLGYELVPPGWVYYAVDVAQVLGE